MKLTISRGEIKAAVAGFSKVVCHRPSLPILSSSKFATSKGVVTAEVTDLDQVARFQFANSQAEGEGVFVIPFQNLKELAKGADGETIDLLSAEKDDITITNRLGAHVVTHTVTGLPAGDWPPCANEIVTAPADRFLPTYRRCAPFASADATRRVLNGVYIDLEGKGERKATLVACDGRRLTCCNSLNLPIKGEHGVIVPITKFLTWPGLGDEGSIGCLKKKMVAWFGVTAGPWLYQVKLVDGVYPNWRQVLPHKDDPQHQIAFADPDVQAMKGLLPSLPGSDGVAIVCSPDGRVALAGRNAGDKAETTVELTAGTRYTGKGARLLANRFFLLEALLAGFRNFGFNDVMDPMRADDDQGGTHVLMPLRVGNVPPAAAAQQPEPPAAESAENTAAVAAPEAAPQPGTPATSTPAADTPPPETHKEKKKTMPPENTTTEPTALDKMQSAYEVAKGKIRETSLALAELAGAIKDAAKEDKARRAEVENVRAGLAKLQAIKV